LAVAGALKYLCAKVDVERGGAACKVPLASKSILKAKKAGRVGKKPKTIKS
jgi:hypothetical protein